MDGRGHSQNQFAVFHGPYEIPAQTYYIKNMLLDSHCWNQCCHCPTIQAALEVPTSCMQFSLQPAPQDPCPVSRARKMHQALAGSVSQRPVPLWQGRPPPRRKRTLHGGGQCCPCGFHEWLSALASWDAKSGMDKGNLLQLSDLIESLTSKTINQIKIQQIQEQKLTGYYTPTIPNCNTNYHWSFGQASSKAPFSDAWPGSSWEINRGEVVAPLLPLGTPLGTSSSSSSWPSNGTCGMAWRDMERPNMAMEMKWNNGGGTSENSDLDIVLQCFTWSQYMDMYVYNYI